ncbi:MULTISPECIES: VOC family protein [unclassified Curtobacterium]|uniref:VOC family protein n=1 Tax=unclassified Curtobacterium TaxID=257496 RepID=UPI00381961A3
MRITTVTLPTRSLDAVAAFWQALDARVAQDDAAVRVRVGHTEVVHVEADFDGDHHLAFTIPTGSFDQADRWIGERAAVLTRDGVREFAGPAGWNSRSVYFDGPDGQVLEFIERRDLTPDHDGPFTVSSITGVSEVGVVTTDVLRTAAELGRNGVAPYAAAPSPAFAAVGDVHGLLVLVAPGRPWLPTTDRIAADTAVTIDGGLAAPIELGPGKVLR